MSLQQTLEKMVEAAKERIPADVRQVMHDATEAQRTSGILDGVKGEGDQAPDFHLPSSDGTTFHLKEALAGGPVVLSFYRGVW